MPYDAPPCSCLTFDRNLSPLNEDGFTELAKLCEGLHPAADVHFVFFSYVQTINCLLSVRLYLQLKIDKLVGLLKQEMHYSCILTGRCDIN